MLGAGEIWGLSKPKSEGLGSLEVIELWAV